MTTKTFTVTGMKCVHCEAHVAEALKAVEGVENAKASHETNSAEVSYDETRVSPEQLKESVDNLGRYELILS